MVDGPSEGGGGEGVDLEKYIPYLTYDKRFKLGMGRFFGAQICQWQVVTGRIVAAHQPPQAISSSESGSRGFWGTGQ